MTSGIRIVDGISKWVRESVGADAENRGDGTDRGDTTGDERSDETDNGDSEPTESAAEDSDRAESDYDSPACCSAASSTDVTVFDE